MCVVQQQAGCTNVIVVDVGDGGQVDVTPAGDDGQLRQTSLQRKATLVSANFYQQASLATPNRAGDKQRVTVRGGQSFKHNGG